MMRDSPLMVGLGELLWDLLPSGKVLGGAPANFAYMATMLGDEGIVASRLGNDELGREACDVMRSLGLSTAYVQHDDEQLTGTAGIVLYSGGQPRFTIKDRVAWDFLEWTPAWAELSARADVVCFGSLAQRSAISAATIDRFLKNLPQSAIRICDANLREPFYGEETLRNSFRHADIVKVNQAELIVISKLMNLGVDDTAAIAHCLMEEFDLKLVCITRDENGSVLVSQTHRVEHPGFKIEIADAIGAGDAFTACLAHYYLLGAPLEEISERANRIGSWVATQVGATPVVQGPQLQDILNGTPRT
jgi:fructokinase